MLETTLQDLTAAINRLNETLMNPATPTAREGTSSDDEEAPAEQPATGNTVFDSPKFMYSPDLRDSREVYTQDEFNQHVAAGCYEITEDEHLSVQHRNAEPDKPEPEPTPEPEPEPTPEPTPEPANEPSYTIDDVRRNVAPLGKERGLALLKRFNANKLSDVDPSDYAELIAAAKGE